MKTPEPIDKRQGWSKLQRPRFSAGLLLEDEDLTASVAYTRSLMQLMLSSLFGCGVVCGLEVDAWLTCHGRKLKVTVRPGLALDGMGNPIHLTGPETLVFDPKCERMPTEVWVAVCHVEKSCRPKDVSCSADEDSRVEPTRTVDGYEIKLYKDPPGCVCSCGAERRPEPPSRGCCQDSEPQPPDTNRPSDLGDRIEQYQADTGTAGAPAPGLATPPGIGEMASQRGDDREMLAMEKARARKLACACFKDHNDGKCGCDCGDKCVWLARIVVDASTTVEHRPEDDADLPLKVFGDLRRRIRPLLTGFLSCLEGAEVPPKSVTRGYPEDPGS